MTWFALIFITFLSVRLMLSAPSVQAVYGQRPLCGLQVCCRTGGVAARRPRHARPAPALPHVNISCIMSEAACDHTAYCGLASGDIRPSRLSVRCASMLSFMLRRTGCRGLSACCSCECTISHRSRYCGLGIEHTRTVALLARTAANIKSKDRSAHADRAMCVGWLWLWLPVSKFIEV